MMAKEVFGGWSALTGCMPWDGRQEFGGAWRGFTGSCERTVPAPRRSGVTALRCPIDTVKLVEEKVFLHGILSPFGPFREFP
jgi:hypothetical protein